MSALSTKKIYLIGAVSLVLGLVFNYLFYNQFIGISFLIYIGLLLSILFSLLFIFKIPYQKKVIWYVPAIIFFALMVGVRENEFLLFWNIVLTLILLLLLAHQLIGRRLRKYLFIDYLLTVVPLPLQMLGKSFSSLGRMIMFVKNRDRSSKNTQIFKGIAITLPIVIFFLFLFSSADLAFNRIIGDIFNLNFHLSQSLSEQIWLTLVLTIIWLGVYTYILDNTGRDEHRHLDMPVRAFKFGNIEAGILFSSLSVLFLTFVIVQIKYLFAGHEAITKFGYTYAEYVHKGFGELIFVALLTFALIFLAERYIERRDNQASISFKILTGILIILVLVIMSSAFMRLGIYEQAYGFTLMRLLVQAFIIWLALIFVWLGYKIIRDIDDRSFIFGLFISVMTFFAVLNLLNPDAFIAQKNIDQFSKSETLDGHYLTTLSADAVPKLMPLLELPGIKDKEGNQLSVTIASSLKNYYEISVNQSWKSYNLSRNEALKLINIKWVDISFLAAQSSLQEDEIRVIE